MLPHVGKSPAPLKRKKPLSIHALHLAHGVVRRQCTLSGRTHAGLLRRARTCGYRVVLHCILIDSAAQAIERVALRVKMGGHDVPEADVRRRFERSRRHLLEAHLPLADEWGVWDNQEPPPRQIADSETHNAEQLHAMLQPDSIQETPTREMSEMSKIVLEAGRVATEKMLDLYKRMGIEVTPQMTLVRKDAPLTARDKG